MRAAFAVAGAACRIEAWEPRDIGTAAMDAVCEDGDRTRARLDSMVEAVDMVGASVDAMAKYSMDSQADA